MKVPERCLTEVATGLSRFYNVNSKSLTRKIIFILQAPFDTDPKGGFFFLDAIAAATGYLSFGPISAVSRL